ncbi:MAG: D-ribose pyranase [Spirochaetales bacterium]|jgi:D-ribose pyranase|nr:D-ribose pyranase [Spirochaetales bacterium]
MKKGRMLNSMLSKAIASMGHGDCLMITDAGFPIPEEKRIDLALEADKPLVEELLALIISDFIYERVVTADELRDYNPNLFKKVSTMCDRCDVETLPHADLVAEYTQKAKYIIRSGGFQSWGNIVLYSGVDAPLWFTKPGIIVPDYYKKRVSCQD